MLFFEEVIPHLVDDLRADEQSCMDGQHVEHKNAVHLYVVSCELQKFLIEMFPFEIDICQFQSPGDELLPLLERNQTGSPHS